MRCVEQFSFSCGNVFGRGLSISEPGKGPSEDPCAKGASCIPASPRGALLRGGKMQDKPLRLSALSPLVDGPGHLACEALPASRCTSGRRALLPRIVACQIRNGCTSLSSARPSAYIVLRCKKKCDLYLGQNTILAEWLKRCCRNINRRSPNWKRW